MKMGQTKCVSSFSDKYLDVSMLGIFTFSGLCSGGLGDMPIGLQQFAMSFVQLFCFFMCVPVLKTRLFELYWFFLTRCRERGKRIYYMLMARPCAPGISLASSSFLLGYLFGKSSNFSKL